MSKNNEILDDYAKYYMSNFGKPKLVVQRAFGSRLTDVDGREYIDLLGGIAVNALGHAHPELLRTINVQASQMMHVSNFFTTEPQVKLAKKLAELVDLATGIDGAPGKNNARVLLTNSGTESVEAALKIIKEHANASTGKGKIGPKGRILALNHSFHGRTLGALSVTSKEKYRTPFNPLIPNVEFIDPTIPALKKAFADKSKPVAGIILECIQGEAGVVPIPVQFIQEARKITKNNGALLVVDEVQTGVGRTGRWFAFERAGIVPDVVTLAKGLGGGFPIGAVIALNGTSEILEPGDHGTTFGGNPLACSVALKVLEIIEGERLLQNARSSFDAIVDTFENLENPYIKDIRGKGLLVGIELKTKKGAGSVEVAAKCLENGLIVNNVNESTIRLAPALNITPAELHQGLRILNKSIYQIFDPKNKLGRVYA